MIEKIWPALIGAIGGIIVGYFVLQGTQETVESSNSQAFMVAQIEVNNMLLSEIKALKNENIEAKNREEDWRNRYIEKSLENLRLEKLHADAITEADIVKRWTEDLPYAGWSKRRNEKGEFVLVTINQRFTSDYGLTQREAEGKTDLMLFPKELALTYMADDEQVDLTGVPLTKIHPYIKKDGTTIMMKHIKFRMNFLDGTTGVGGLVLPLD